MPTNINLWVDYIGEQSVPLFQSTVNTLLGAVNDEDVTCKELADYIIRDPALTQKILKVANSSFYNHSDANVYDIRRAVLVIGFNKIYEIGLTTAIIETLIRRSTYQYVYELMAQSCAAAVFAHAIAVKMDLEDIDELFISALLWNFGEIAFWSLSGQAGGEISEQLRLAAGSKEEAQRKILGTTFKELTKELSKKWSLTELLDSALCYPNEKDKRIQCIQLGYKLTGMYTKGISFNDKCRLIHETSKLIGQEYLETIDFVHEITNESKEIAFLHLAYDL